MVERYAEQEGVVFRHFLQPAPQGEDEVQAREVLHEVPEEFEDLAFEPPSLDLLVEGGPPHPSSGQGGHLPVPTIRHQGTRSRTPTAGRRGRTPIGNLHCELMVALQAPAYRIGNSVDEVAHAVEAEAVQIDEDAPVSGSRWRCSW